MRVFFIFIGLKITEIGGAFLVYLGLCYLGHWFIIIFGNGTYTGVGGSFWFFAFITGVFVVLILISTSILVFISFPQFIKYNIKLAKKLANRK